MIMIRGKLTLRVSAKSTLHRTTAIACVCLALPTAAFAQIGEADDAANDDIIVYGAKLERDAGEVAGGLSVVTGEDIARRPVTELYELVQRLPNVAESFGGQGFNIRGIDQRGVSGGGNGQTLSVYVDDAVLSNRQTFFGPLDVWDLEQVEVYRGPQATRFGRNALAGAIYIRTADPEFDWSARVRGEIGNFDTRMIGGAVGGPLAGDVLAFRLAASHRESDGFITNRFLDAPADPFEATTVRGKLLLRPAPNISLLISGQYNESFGGEDGLTPALALDRTVNYDFAGREGNETGQATARLTADLGSGFELTAIVAHQNADYLRREDFDGTPTPGATLDRTGKDRFTSQEVRVRWEGDTARFVVGGYHLTSRETFVDSFQVPITFINPRLPLTNLIGRTGTFGGESENWAVFADGEIDIAPRFSVFAGIRYDNEETAEETDTVTRILGTLPAPFAFLRGVVESDVTASNAASFDAWLPRFGVRYALSERVSADLTVSRGYRAGGSEFNIVTGAPNNFAPEYLWNYEAGVRARSSDGRVRGAASIFYADWDNQQVSVPAAPGLANVFITANAGTSRLWGIELEGDYRLTPALTLQAAVGYVDTEFTDFPVTDPVLGATNFRDNRFPFAARWTGSVGIDWREARGPFVNASLSWRSSYFSDAANDPQNRIGGRVLVDGTAGWQFERFSLSGFVRNAFDRDYLSFVNRAGTGLARVGAPRVYGLRIDAGF